jgi:spore germination protein GerM
VGAVLFWVVFAIVMIILFMVNRDRILNTVRNAPSPAWSLSKEQPGATPVATVSGNATNVSPESAPPESLALQASLAEQASPDSASPQTVSSTVEEGVPIARPSVPETAATSSRTLYFIQVAQDGTILRSRVTRAVPASSSPLLEAIQMLVKGTNADEQSKGLVSLIPANTRILSVIIRGETAYIDMSEEFQYNSHGVEGYAAQLHQIVWTATEFSSVKNVQLLIEGRRIDWLGEGLWIGSPLNRTSL